MGSLFKVATIPGKVTKSPHSYKNAHWSVYQKIRNEWHKALLAKFGPCPEELRGKKRKLKIVQYRIKKMDKDNFGYSCKPIIDVLKQFLSYKVNKKDKWLLDTGIPKKELWPRGLGWLVEDDERWLEGPEFLQIKVHKRKDQKTIITIEDCDE